MLHSNPQVLGLMKNFLFPLLPNFFFFHFFHFTLANSASNPGNFCSEHTSHLKPGKIIDVLMLRGKISQITKQHNAQSTEGITSIIQVE